MFEDPQVIIGMVIGVAIVVAGTVLGVLGHLRAERGAVHDVSAER